MSHYFCERHPFCARRIPTLRSTRIDLLYSQPSDLQAFTRGQLLTAYWPNVQTSLPTPLPFDAPCAIGFTFGMGKLAGLGYNLMKVA